MRRSSVSGSGTQRSGGKRGMKRILSVLIVAIALAGCSENPVAPVQYDVTYKVTVEGSSIGWLTFVIFMDECGELQSVDSMGYDWRYDFWPETVPSGTYLYLSAQGWGYPGCNLRAEIWIDGEIRKFMECGVEDTLIVFCSLP